MDKNTINNRSCERQMERKRALETLKKSQRGVSRNDAFKKPQQVAAPNKNNVKTCINLPVNKRVDNTDFMSSRRPNTINISDLVTDESIHLESVPSCPSSSSKGLKISFEPAEITGRSTLCKKDLRYARNVPGDTLTKNITVNEILASSFAQKARNLCETLNDRDTTISSAVAVHKGNYINVRGQNPASSCTTLSSVSSYNNSLSLPRTADMSLSKISATELTFNSNADNGISFINGTDTSTDNTENFVPGELMQSRLLSDEISWAGQFAAIPTVALSELAKAKADISNNFELNSRSNSILADDPNFSVGNFFNMRSDKICNIVPSKSPERCRTTVALVDETPDVSSSAPFLYSVESPSRTSITPKVDNKTYTRVGEAAFVQNHSKAEAKYQSINSNYDSKDSGNSTGNYAILSMSAIDRALSNLDARLDKDAKTHSCMEPFRDVNDSISHVVNDEVHRRKRATIMDTNIKLFGEEKFNFENEALLANKQNLDPQAILSPKCTQLSDTVSFTQPLLNSSEIQQNETPKVSRSGPFLYSVESPSRTSITPKVDNKKYTRVGEAAFVQNQSKVEAKYQSINSNYDSKDSGNSTENSYILSMSAIDRALSNLNARLDKDAKSHSCMDPFRDENDSISHVVNDEVHRRKRATIMNTNIKLFGEEKLNFENEALLANKENLDPQAILSPKCTQLSDTVSFTQSLLNSSEIQQTQCNLNVQSRSPLSPIEINSNSAAAVPHIITEILDGEVADNDEWPSTPVVGPNRRVKRKKSPRNPSPLKSSADDPKTPVNPKYKSSTLRPDDINQPKSMSSTRLDCADENGINNCCELISPKLSINKSSSAMLPRHSNGSSNIILSDRQDHDCSPGRLNQSPLSRSTVLPQICSNINDMQSPNMDRTSSPDRHMLTAAAGASELPVCSPVSSETSSTTSRIYRNGPSVTSAVGRSASRCSSSSEFSHSDGKQIPLKVTATELSWGSVKLRTDSRKSMQVKNISNKRLVVRIEVCGPGFQIYNLQGSNAVTIHPQECRAITVNFCPTVCGVAVGKLSLRAPLGCSGAVSASQSFLDIALYGYGGNAKIYPQDIIPAPVGLPFIKVGDISELGEPLRRGFSIYNKGPLVGFAVVAVDSLGLMMPRLSEAFEIRPKQIIIPPSDFVCVNIKFSPKREEIKKIVKKVGQVLTVANMRIVCGDDANRQRIRRLFYQMSTEERSKYSSSILDMLWSKFPDEIELDELNAIHESPSTAMDLTACLRVHEIALTVNNFFWNETAESSLLFGSDADETVLFRTICSAPDSECPSANLYPVDEESTVVTSDSEEKCTVTPEVLDIYLVRPGRMSLLLKNTQKLRQFFKILCNHENAMRFKPADGFVDPNGGQTEIEIILNEDTNVIAHLNDIFIMIFMNDERIRVPVNVHD